MTRAVSALWASLSGRRRRVQIYVGLGILSFALSIASMYARPHDHLTLVVSDGAGYYAYLPSVFIDRDLDLGNQLFPMGEVRSDRAVRTPTGRVANKYPIGVSVTLAPAFVVAHLIATAAHAMTGAAALAPDGYTLIYQLLCLAFVVALSVLTMIVIDKLAVGALGIDPRAVGMAVVLYWLGSPYLFYLVRQPFMAHIIGAFWVAAALGAFEVARRARLQGGKARGSLCLLGLAIGMAVITRPTNATLLVFPTYLAVSAIRERHSAHRAELFFVGFALVPLAAQMLVWKAMSGSYLYYSYGKERFDWLHPKLLQTLLSSRHGLIFWTPLIVFALLGLAARRSLRQPLLNLGIAGLVLLWFANSAWHSWWFAGAFGARAFLDVAALFILGLAMYLEDRFRIAGRGATTVAVAIGACVVYSWALAVLFVLKLIPNEDAVLPWF